ncbi:MAG: FAD-dependent oxidoreductase [bacterium]
MAIEGKIKTDVFVLGGGMSGTAAALGAAKSGARVALAERHYLLGGTATEALVSPMQTFHSRTGRVIGGVAQELVDRIQARGGSPGHLPDPVGFAASVTPADPDILKSAYAEWLAEENIATLLGHRLHEVNVADGRIASVEVEDENGNVFDVEAGFYVDASGNGDLTSAAGCEMEIDPDCQPMTLIFTLENVDAGAIIAYQKKHPDEFHMHANMAVLDRGYIGVSGFFSHVNKARERGCLNIQRDRLLFFGNARPGQVVVNTTRLTGYRGLYGDEISDAMRAGLEQVWELFVFMKNEIPGFGRARIARIADHIGVRETRRLIGRYVMNENDILATAHFDDAIAMGAYPMDIHSATDASISSHYIEGKGHYDIPLRCLLNKGVENLITVGKCISVTHKGFSSTRVMPTCMAVGHAGGVAAALASRGKKDPEALLPEIQDTLRKQFAIIREEDVVKEKL